MRYRLRCADVLHRNSKRLTVERSEGLLLVKADIQDQDWNHRQFTGWRMSALPPIAAVEVISASRSACDPKQPFAFLSPTMNLSMCLRHLHITGDEEVGPLNAVSIGD
jgi:hypothetical protein